MAVLLPNTTLGVRRRVDTTDLDAHGNPVQGGWEPLAGPWPGRVREDAAAAWVLGVDPAAWPLRQHDRVVEPSTGREWTVTAAQDVRHPEDPTVEYVRVEGYERAVGGTEPGGAYFAGR